MRMPADRLVSPPFFAARHPCLLRAGLAAVLALAATGAFAQAAITIYGGARAGGEFVDANDADNVIELDSGAAASLSVDCTHRVLAWPTAEVSRCRRSSGTKAAALANGS